ncbi:threonine-phosphate decarboxylase CobD [Xanthomonas prunicola]|uniref:threonine-phosphate decarboxylase n=1 Tax=Xanthomonas prunicola TaxID=2053930 RepID=A0A9Q9IW29_9XANT|nr:threonine-phosphate decarboxylase CobD [Xanthomonas prunicola]USI99519.1 threonine-phosphate decarboxylase CobD [Xanthomonas prunicola]UXA47969.1 threonine-phosphate decarboxylase CobD [Xanthomonas prunicola]UXA56433.1 threonine-phosphate decarboxylase CobD [Xanthomonas prunicola]UXA62390.1 threonine-phosphate decarboxylase CobD [Xanthomonas prunicola]UXA64592.1 threonine-phosphate decarboxylase CobD [Xanthomonas prunicola]
MLEHGGRLRRAARTYKIPLAQWLDLSTGVSPFAWPVPTIPEHLWQRLPEDDDGLAECAAAYYGAPQVLPVAGSQAAIQTLPLLRASGRVGVLMPGYAEHAQAWQRAGHQVVPMCATQLLQAGETLDVIVLIHPNNPCADSFDPETLLQLHACLASRGGWLVIDEAFMDATPQHSVCADTQRPGLVVLRSVGKFFGMAGARAGFVCAHHTLLDALRERLGPWTLSGPARWVVQQALADTPWQLRARARLHAASQRLGQVLHAHSIVPTAGTAFFQWCQRDDAAAVHAALAQRGILTRLFDAPSSVRFGLPRDAADESRLDAALRQVLT